MPVYEFGYAPTPLGELTLRRRDEPMLGGVEVWEVRLGDDYLMSSLFTESERQLAILGLAPLNGELDIVVGGLGLGYTAAEALKNENVRRVLVIDLFPAVIEWHQRGLVPIGDQLAKDPRCELRQGDFFALARTGFDANEPGKKFDAVLLDIDHTPELVLNESNRSFYSPEGLASIRNQLKPGGTFALWSDDPANEKFTALLRDAFGTADSHNIEFPNPYTRSTSVNAVYVAQNLPGTTAAQKG
jgi:spermidine synthase